jgi:acetyltransferase-like isoleucine patch superfamily enzyme
MLKQLVHIILSIPKTVYINLICFPFRTAVRLPILISYRVSLKKIHRGSIVIKGNPQFALMKLGFWNGSFDMSRRSGSYLNISKEGKMVLKGKLNIPNGSIINVTSGKLEFGNNFDSNANLKISCEKGITFGDDVVIGWNCNFIDGDGHSILNHQGVQTNKAQEITVGNHIWFCAEVSVFKGTTISDDSVISYGSHVFKDFTKPNCLIGGNPAKVLKENINWKK